MNSVYYEVGMLRREFGTEEFGRKIKLFVQTGVDWNSIAFYIKKYVPSMGGIIPFEDWDQLPEMMHDYYQSFFEF